MKALHHTNCHSTSRRGYTLVEVIAASGLMAGAIAAAAALSMTMANQEEAAKTKAAAIRYGEAVARLWQLGVNPNNVLLTQTQPQKDASTYSAMSWAVQPASTPTALGDDGGISDGSVETATVNITWRPYGNTTDATLSFDVMRPPAAHR